MEIVPVEVQLLIFNMLPTSTLLTASQVCREWCCLARDSLIWRRRFRSEVAPLLPTTITSSSTSSTTMSSLTWFQRYARETRRLTLVLDETLEPEVVELGEPGMHARCMAFLPDGVEGRGRGLLITGCKRGRMEVVEVGEESQEWKYDVVEVADRDAINSMCVLEGRRTPCVVLGMGRQLGGAVLWDVGKGEVVGQVGGHTDSVFGVASSAHHPWVATGGGQDDGRVLVHDVSEGGGNGRVVAELFHRGSVRAVAFDPLTPHTLLSGSLDKCLRLWDLRTGMEAGEGLEIKLPAGVHSLALPRLLSHDQVVFASCGRPKNLLMAYDLRAIRPELPLATANCHSSAVSSLHIDAFKAVSISYDGSVAALSTPRFLNHNNHGGDVVVTEPQAVYSIPNQGKVPRGEDVVVLDGGYGGRGQLVTASKSGLHMWQFPSHTHSHT